MFGRKGSQEDPLLGKPASFGIHRYLQGSANLFEENRLLKVAIAGMFGVTAVLGVVIYTTNQNARTIIVPFGATGDLHVSGNKPSEAYIVAMTRNIVALSGTWSAYSADRQFQELLGLAHPSAYGAMRDSLNAVLDELANNPTLSIATYIRGDREGARHRRRDPQIPGHIAHRLRHRKWPVLADASFRGAVRCRNPLTAARRCAAP